MILGAQGFHFGDPGPPNSIKKQSWNSGSVFDRLFSSFGTILAPVWEPTWEQHRQKSDKHRSRSWKAFQGAFQKVLTRLFGVGWWDAPVPGRTLGGVQEQQTLAKNWAGASKTWRQEPVPWNLARRAPAEPGAADTPRRIPPARPSTRRAIGRTSERRADSIPIHLSSTS